jgi:UDP-GlcNAc3NAcA epimerase
MKPLYKIISVVGARPQFIKLAALQLSITKEPRIQHLIVHSGQHYDHPLSGQFFEELNIPVPHYNIGIGSHHHNVQTAKCIIGMDEILEIENPDLVIVYGDTNTTAAAAIATAKRNIPLAHVEAGLREYDKSIPEEINKLITDAITDLYFSPTTTGVENLKKQGITENVYLTGDISLDLLVHNKNLDNPLKYDVIYQNIPKPYIFLTCHRAVNTDHSDHLREIVKAITLIEQTIIFALHPRTKKALERESLLSLIDKKNVYLLEPPGFWETQYLIKNAAFVITDSGGVIKEAYFHKVPAIIIDKQTEWVETVEEGWNTIAGPSHQNMINVMKNWQKPDRHSNCIGDGNAGERIIKNMLQYLDAKK